MAQHNCRYQDPTDDPSAVPTASQASSDNTLKPKCAHHPMVTQCNQSQYLTLMKKKGVHSPYAIQTSHTNLSNSLVSPYPPDPGEHVLKRSSTSTGEQDTPVQWFKFIHPSPKPRITKSSFQIAVHMAYSPINSVNYKWIINLHDTYPLYQVMKSQGYITPSLHILKHDLSNLAPPKGETKSSFSWTSLFKSPTSSTLCFGEPTLGNLNQGKLLCSISSSTLWDPTLAKSNQETELCITKHIPLCDSSVHTGTPFSVPSSSSETNRVSNSHSSLVTTPSSRIIHGRPKIEVTKVPTHNNGKNGEHFDVENWHNTTKNGMNSDRNSSLVTMDLIHHVGSNGEHSCVVFNLNNTSCGFMLKEVDWGGKHPINSVVDWQRHETYPTGYNISEVDWGALHDSSLFLFLVNFDYDAKPKDFLTHQLFGGLPERTSSTTLRSSNHI